MMTSPIDKLSLDIVAQPLAESLTTGRLSGQDSLCPLNDQQGVRRFQKVVNPRLQHKKRVYECLLSMSE